MKRWELINLIIKKRNFKHYLEIGVDKGVCFENVQCEIKDGVDPNNTYDKNNYINYNVDSDIFFKNNTKKYDLIFIDGLHHKNQVDNDILNSLLHTQKNGIIIIHDCNPPTKKHSEIPRQQKEWNGDVYKSVLEFQINNIEHTYFTLNSDWGLGVIIKNKKQNEILNKDFYLNAIYSWDFFCENRKILLNLIEPNDFLIKFDEIFNI